MNATGFANAVVSASLTMTVVGIVTALVLSRLSVQSWRLQSCLIAAVLLQGVMLVRTPIHLGWIESESVVTMPVDARVSDEALAAMELPVAGGQTTADRSLAAGEFAASRISDTVFQYEFSWQASFFIVWLIGLVTLVGLAVIGYVR